MELSIIIVNWNTFGLLADCLNSIYKNAPQCDFEVLIVDNASSDGSVDRIRLEFPQAALITNQKNIGFAPANNQAVKIAKGDFLLLLNPDTVVFPGALDALLAYIQQHPQVAAVGPKLLNGDGTLQVSASPAPTLFREFWRLFHLDRLVPISQYPHSIFRGSQAISVDVLKGACILVRAAVIDPGGVFDEDYFMYSEEVDLCERLRRKHWRLDWLPGAVVTHLGGMSTRQAADAMFLELYRHKIMFFRKNRGPINTFAYKMILYLASSMRIFLCWLAGNLPVPNRVHLHQTLKNYQALWTALPNL